MKISVIIPAYNAQAYIRTAIESCLQQTYPPHEIIVADDASADSTSEVAASFGGNVRVLRLRQNSGPSTARNEAIKLATGDWLAFLDADDWFFPEKLARQRQCSLENTGAILIYSAFETSLNGIERPARFYPPQVLWPMLRYRCAFHIGTVLLRRDAFDSVGGFDPTLRGGEDWDLWIRLARKSSVASFAAVSEPLAVYRTTPGSFCSDSMRIFKWRKSLLETRLLDGTVGLSKALWRQWILAFQYYDVALALREEGSSSDLQYLVKSLLAWPFPSATVPGNRYKIMAVMLRQHLLGY
jgi:glycosyltransferase involved in cell wall biosynthesis